MRHHKLTSAGVANNLIDNPTPATACYGWSPRNGNAQPAVYFGKGEGVLCTATADSQSYGFFYNDSSLSGLGLSPGDTVSARVDVVANSGGAVQLSLRFMSGSTTLSNSSGPAVSSGTARCENTVIPANCDSIIIFTASQSTAIGQTVLYNRLMLTKASAAPAAFKPGTKLRPADRIIAAPADSVRTTSLPGGPLPWAPPIANPASATVINVTDDPATRYITLSSGQDCILVLPNTPLGSSEGIYNRDSLITVTGGRHVQVIGGHIYARSIPPTHTTTVLGATETVIPVSSTAGFPTTGALRLDGEVITYTTKTATTFTGCSRNAGFFNTGTGSSYSAHAMGALVYIGENSRSALTFFQQTGTVHVEGLLLDGALNDGIRIFRTGAQAGTGALQVQNCHIGPYYCLDSFNFTDGHPDGIQVIAAPGSLKVARCTFMVRTGQGIFNQGGANGSPLAQATVQDSEIIGLSPQVTHSINDTDSPMASWTLNNVWALSKEGDLAAGQSAIDASISKARSGQIIGQFCPATSVGIGYVSPGYL